MKLDFALRLGSIFLLVAGSIAYAGVDGIRTVSRYEAAQVFGTSCTLTGGPKDVADKCNACGGTASGTRYTSTNNSENHSSSASSVNCNNNESCTQTVVSSCS